MSIFESFSTALWRIAALLLFAGALAALGWWGSAVAPVEMPTYGVRGRRRAALRAESSLFRRAEPALRMLAAVLVCFVPRRLVAVIERALPAAGDPGGILASEWLVLCGCTAFATLVFAQALGLDATLSLALSCVLGTAPLLRVLAQRDERMQRLERSLPFAIDLCVLSMGAGSDFVTALRFAVAELGVGHEACREELSLVLEHLALGHTRVEALGVLAARTDRRVVQQLAAAVSQSETKGTPLVATLTIQARVLREQRSVRAEELAARAGVKMMMPLMLMVVSLLLVILGPFIVNGVGL